MTSRAETRRTSAGIAAETAPGRTAVIGLGNILMSDDGIGRRVIDALDGQVRDTVDLIDGGTLGFLLLDRLAGCDHLILVDAARMGSAVGEARVFRDEDVDGFLLNSTSTSVHEVGLVDLLLMLRLGGNSPRRCSLVCIEPQEVGWGLSLSPPVEAALAHAVRLVMNEILEVADA
ncbi:hydrogenase maturation protease [Oryzibacter oryziterrae]|uniref:hydrogenase maturation protease n=1 Tax=Oryzibacter oryziterrae TaxID=2766474 RepID=UPI001F010B95|nr:hydrogenase maturation protease [Oryzibacter oryziterrae]